MRKRHAGVLAGRYPKVAPVALLVAASAVALGACGSTSSGSSGAAAHGHAVTGSPHDIVLASVDATESTRSAAVDLDISASGTPTIGGVSGQQGSAPISLSITGHGVFDFVDKVGQMSIDLPATNGQPAGSLQIRLVGGAVYLSAPQVTSLDGGKPWVKVDASKYLQKQGQDSGPLGGFSDGDPTQALAMLEQLGTNVTVAGHQVIDGAQTTEYDGSIDLSSVGTRSSTSSTVISKQLMQALGLSTLPVKVWVDDAGRARQVQTTLTVFGITVSATEKIGSFGIPVTVTAPPSADTADGTALLDNGQLGNLLGSSVA
jgi:hypothetical protein